ncbi:MAG: hypothetical protein HY689_09455 [Chloroflexi bacterium]|nr:hypothetical protein [Chloroflexota bacterium]
MPVATVWMPPDVAARLDSIARLTGLPRREAASLLLTLLLRQPPAPTAAEEGHSDA